MPLSNIDIKFQGEVGTEMYIVVEGSVEVVGGENDSIVFVTLGVGSVFGEIRYNSIPTSDSDAQFCKLLILIPDYL